MHASFWTNLMPEIWLDPMRQHSPDGLRMYNALSSVRIIGDFIDELLGLHKAGVNSRCVSIVLEGQQEASRLAWEIVKDTAATLDAMENCQYA
jgi:hypothetical protein